MASQDKKIDPSSSEFRSRAVLLAGELGRLAGTLEGTAETWLNRTSLTDQLTKIRDTAAELLESVMNGAASGREAARRPGAPQPVRQSADAAHAPGKRHRKPAPSVRGAKKSNQSIPKMRTATAVRQRRKSYA